MEILQRLQHYLLPFATEVLRVAIWFLLPAVVFVPLEKLFSLHPQKIFRKSFPTDLAYYFLNSLLPGMLLATPMAFVAWCLHHVIPGRLHVWTASMPLWGRLVTGLVAGEFGFYWGHRWMHEVPFLWRFHSIHHSAEEMDWLVNARAHPLDVVFGRLCGFVPMYALGLVQPMMGNTVDMMPLAVTLVGILWGYFIHANLRCRQEWLALVVSTPAFHHWHHTNDEHVDKNYASMLPFLDKLFGTWYLPAKQWPSKYGTDSPVAPGLPGQLLDPFLPQEEKVDAQTAPVAG
jgi:sterol desaturase/sphingolipid hydroxylase (fatty acid hydroxylase superfamily)